MRRPLREKTKCGETERKTEVWRDRENDRSVERQKTADKKTAEARQIDCQPNEAMPHSLDC